MIQYQSYTASSLKEFLNSLQYRNLKNIPVSLHRAESWLHNPRMKENDLIMVIAWEQDQIIAYRSVLPDEIRFMGQRCRFAWMSGNWVRPDYRRKGISTALYKTIYDAWEGRLAYTNYAPASKAVYDKTSDFIQLYDKTGYRFYLSCCLSKLLPERNRKYRKALPLLFLIDTLANLLLLPWFIFRFLGLGEKKDVVFLKEPDGDCMQLVRSQNSSELTQRGENEFRWIFSFPWILQTPFSDELQTNYHFSSSARRYDLLTVKLLNPKKETQAFFILSNKDGAIHVPYLYAPDVQIARISQLIVQLSYSLKGKYLTLFEPRVIGYLRQQGRFRFFLKKKFHRDFYVAKNLLPCFSEKRTLQIQDGEGDVVFT